jgi:hypothetical protein
MQELTAEWVGKADDDFYSTDLVLHAGQFPIAGYYSDKTLKVFFVIKNAFLTWISCKFQTSLCRKDL